ncbi:MAG: TRAP transporter small permease subunit [Pseudomonadota bacterium]
MATLARFLAVLGWIPLAVSCTALFGLMIMTFADVVLRSALSAPIEAAPELTRIAVAVVVFGSLPVLSARGGHISVDLLDPLFDRAGVTRVWNGFMAIACGVILWWPANRVVDLAERSRSYGDLTEFLELPVHLVSWAIAILTFATMAALILRGFALLFVPALVVDPDQ